MSGVFVATAIARTGLLLLLLATGGCGLFERAAGPAQPPALPPVTLRFHLAASEPRDEFAPAQDEAGRPLYLAAQPFLTERDVRHAAVFTSTQRQLIRLDLNPDADQRLRRVTAAGIGLRLAVFLDDQLLYSPRIAASLGGPFNLTGDFTPQRAEQIAAALNGQAARAVPVRTLAPAGPPEPPAGAPVEVRPPPRRP